MKPPPDLIRRQQATQATLNKFNGKPFDWAKGHHCAALLRFHLKKAGRAVPPLPPMRNVLAAQRELAARSCADMADILSKVMKLEPISAAQMLPGDLVAVASECGTGSEIGRAHV